jgi:hypothetical protein
MGEDDVTNSVKMAAAALAVAVAMPANAATMVSEFGSAATFAAPTAGATTFTVFDFNTAAIPAGFIADYPLAGSAELVIGSLEMQYQQPAFSDGSQYLAVRRNGSATITSTSGGYNSVSFYIGSIDGYNGVQILNTSGAIIASYDDDDFTTPFPPNGDGTSAIMNRRITYTTDGNDGLIGAIRFSTGDNSLEVDNLVFAVPEPATWLMMMAGFGMIGMSMRARRRRARIVFA